VSRKFRFHPGGIQYSGKCLHQLFPYKNLSKNLFLLFATKSRIPILDSALLPNYGGGGGRERGCNAFLGECHETFSVFCIDQLFLHALKCLQMANNLGCSARGVFFYFLFFCSNTKKDRLFLHKETTKALFFSFLIAKSKCYHTVDLIFTRLRFEGLLPSSYVCRGGPPMEQKAAGMRTTVLSFPTASPSLPNFVSKWLKGNI
jgi:hypothetical protein